MRSVTRSAELWNTWHPRSSKEQGENSLFLHYKKFQEKFLFIFAENFIFGILKTLNSF